MGGPAGTEWWKFFCVILFFLGIATYFRKWLYSDPPRQMGSQLLLPLPTAARLECYEYVLICYAAYRSLYIYLLVIHMPSHFFFLSYSIHMYVCTLLKSLCTVVGRCSRSRRCENRWRNRLLYIFFLCSTCSTIVYRAIGLRVVRVGGGIPQPSRCQGADANQFVGVEADYYSGH